MVPCMGLAPTCRWCQMVQLMTQYAHSWATLSFVYLTWEAAVGQQPSSRRFKRTPVFPRSVSWLGRRGSATSGGASSRSKATQPSPTKGSDPPVYLVVGGRLPHKRAGRLCCRRLAADRADQHQPCRALHPLSSHRDGTRNTPSTRSTASEAPRVVTNAGPTTAPRQCHRTWRTWSPPRPSIWTDTNVLEPLLPGSSDVG
jgi:hypothetical protein